VASAGEVPTKESDARSPQPFEELARPAANSEPSRWSIRTGTPPLEIGFLLYVGLGVRGRPGVPASPFVLDYAVWRARQDLNPRPPGS
jgi:hypothetical protein